MSPHLDAPGGWSLYTSLSLLRMFVNTLYVPVHALDRLQNQHFTVHSAATAAIDPIWTSK